MPMTKYEGMTLTKKVIVLEETWLVNCVLRRRCVIFYSGRSVRRSECDLRSAVNGEFQGSAATDVFVDVDDWVDPQA